VILISVSLLLAAVALRYRDRLENWTLHLAEHFGGEP
jgi:hypothetical protein